jgi:hypothetical protein
MSGDHARFSANFGPLTFAPCPPPSSGQPGKYPESYRPGNSLGVLVSAIATELRSS